MTNKTDVWKILATVVLTCWFAEPLFAQSIEVESADTQRWFQYSYQNKLSDDWSFTWNTGYQGLWKSEIEDSRWERYYLSSSFSYRYHPRLNFNLGSGLYYTTRPVSSDLTEFRTWLGATAYWPDSLGQVRRFVLTHRLRLEQRFTRSSGTSSWPMNSRARYRMSTAIAINRKELEPGAFYLYLGSEWFANLDQDDESFFSNRSQYSVGIGWLTTSKWKIEMRYSKANSRDSETENYHLSDKIIELRVKTTLRIRDRMKEH